MRDDDSGADMDGSGLLRRAEDAAEGFYMRFRFGFADNDNDGEKDEGEEDANDDNDDDDDIIALATPKNLIDFWLESSSFMLRCLQTLPYGPGLLSSFETLASRHAT